MLYIRIDPKQSALVLTGQPFLTNQCLTAQGNECLTAQGNE